MKLADNFYIIHRCETIQDNTYVVEAELLPNHSIYEGHFPGQPVVPGVCTLTIIRECLGRILNKDVKFSSIKDCKYVSALLPYEGLNITINLTLTDASKLNAVVVRNGDQQTVLKLRAEIK